MSGETPRAGVDPVDAGGFPGEEVLEVCPVAILVLNVAGQITYANAQAERVLGVARGEILRRSIHGPEWALTDPAGRPLAEAERPFQRLLAAGQPVRGLPLGIERPDGRRETVVLDAVPVPNASGQVERFVLTLIGISEHIQAGKLEAAGQLAGGVAHDFSNIHAATLLQLGLLRQGGRLDPAATEVVQQVESEIARAAHLTRQLLLLSGRLPVQPVVVNLNELLGELLPALRRQADAGIEMGLRSSPRPAWVRADPGMIEQVVASLCANAREAMPQGGRLTVSIELVRVKGATAGGRREARAGRFVCLSVADTGVGMEARVLTRLFEPFFTTKPPGRGKGLGLATVYGIVKQHEGWVEVTSAKGEGSELRVYLPVVAPPPRELAGPKFAPASGGSILLVEDEPGMRRATALCLRKLGYAVVEAGDGQEALQVWERQQGEIALLLTDMVLPGALSGLELAKRLRLDRGRLEVVLCTGYSEELAALPAVPGPGVCLLTKPFKAAALASLVRRCLERTRDAAESRSA
jgi:two-component system, cell cycle sensor histidine kinase and response regulator CckA